MVERIEPRMAGDEVVTLTEFLDYYRATLLVKVDGLTDEHPDGDMQAGEADTLAVAAAVFRREVAIARQAVESRPFDDLAARPGRDHHPNLRWIMVHMIEEYARHCGHADLLREAIDGQVGD